MRFAKLLLAMLVAAAAIIAGLFAAAVVALTGLTAWVISRFINPRISNTQAAPRARPRTTRINAADAIDVTATEVPADHQQR